MKSMRLASPTWWSAFLLALLAAEVPAQQDAPVSTAEVPAAPDRIVLVGASVSAGFTAAEPLGGTNTAFLRLSRYLDAALLAPDEPVRNLASALFFFKPEGHGRRQIQQALEADPSAIVGIDFLFWFCYGPGATDDDRLQRLAVGLELLEPIKCPLILGDIPDASAAVHRMLRPDQIPSKQAMARANQRIQDWVAVRPHVAILPLADILRACVANKELSVGDILQPEGESRVLLQDDLLHPSRPGCAFIAVSILDTLDSMRPFPTGKGFRSNPAEVFRLVCEPGAALPAAPPPGGQSRQGLAQ